MGFYMQTLEKLQFCITALLSYRRLKLMHNKKKFPHSCKYYNRCTRTAAFKFGNIFTVMALIFMKHLRFFFRTFEIWLL